MTKEEFPRRLREWRKANGLIQKELAEKSGISCRQIQNYEHGTSFPSVEAGRRLVALGFDPAYLPEGVHRVRCPDINAPLTEEEQQFAAKKHSLVYWFLNWAGLVSNRICADQEPDVQEEKDMQVYGRGQRGNSPKSQI